VSGILGWITHSGVVQGVIIGATLAFLTAIVVMNLVLRRITRTVDGWASIPACGRPENGVLVRAACAKALPGVNVFEEAAYWTTTTDAAGRRLDGGTPYVLHFDDGQFPPNDAFWSLTVTDVVGYKADSPTDRHSVDDRSDFVRNADGSVDILLQHAPPADRAQNWLPIPTGRFKLMLRAYLPGPAVLDGTYRVPAVREASIA
jgi:hypothetical protein